MLVLPEDKDLFDRIRARREALTPYATSDSIKQLLAKVDDIGTTWITVNPDDLYQKAIGPLEEAEALAVPLGYKLPADYHKTPAKLLGPQGGTVSDLKDIAGMGTDTVWDTAVSGCKETGAPAWLCETRLPRAAEIPTWAWVGGAVLLAGAGVYLYAAYKILPIAARIGVAAYAPGAAQYLGQAKATPAVQDAFAQKAVMR